jgi:hypothetical protein
VGRLAGLRALAALVYVAVLVLLFVGYYREVRSAPPGTIVDYTIAAFWIGVFAFLPALVISRWWGALLPLVSFPIAAVLLVVGELDEDYAAIAEDRGGPLGAEWFEAAFILCMFAVPAALLGAGIGHRFRQRRR